MNQQNNPMNPMFQPRTSAVIAGIPIGTDEINPKSKNVRSFYSRYAGARYYFSDGGIATFYNGEYKIDAENPENAQRVKELEYVCKQAQPIFSLEKVKVRKSDSKRLRDVSGTMGGVDDEDQGDVEESPPDPNTLVAGDAKQQTGVGKMNTQHLINLAAGSNSK